MQDRYVGDVGDFGKYALLRRLAGTSGEQPIRLGVVWCLFPDESHNNDGRHISYLRHPDVAKLDLDLLAALQKIVESDRRCISAISASGIFPPDTIFCDGAISPLNAGRLTREARLHHRFAWAETCLRTTGGCDLVFFDPDNGIEVSSVPRHHTNAGKYVYWDELATFWRRGHTLLIYHHLNRTMPAANQVHELEARIREKFDHASVRPLVFRRGSCRVFWLIFRESVLGNEIERRALDLLRSGWSAHFRPAEWPDRHQILTRSAR